MSAPVSVRETRDNRGRGLFATRSFGIGDVLFREVPLVAMQSLTQQSVVAVCAQCFRVLGGVEQQLALMVGELDRQSFSEACSAEDALAEATFSRVVPCGQACGQLYCSARCRERHWRRGHQVLCTGAVTEREAQQGHPLVQFKIHAVQTNEAFLLAADVAAHCWLEASKAGAARRLRPDAAQRYRGPFADFVQELWWDCAVAPDPAEADELRASLVSIATEAATLLRLAAEAFAQQQPKLNMARDDQVLDAVFGLATWGRTIGMFEQNNLGIRATHPGYEALKAVCALAAAEDAPADASGAEEAADAAQRMGEAKGHQSVESLRWRRAQAQALAKRLAPLLQAAQEAMEAAVEEDCCDEKEPAERYEDGDDEGAGESGAEESKTMAAEIHAVEEALNAESRKVMSPEPEAPAWDLPASLAYIAAVVEAHAALRAEMEVEGSADAEMALAEASLLPPVDGTALFRVICTMNHSCAPNVKVVYSYSHEAAIQPSGRIGAAPTPPRARLVANVVAVDEVAEGDELSFSYIDVDMPSDDRQDALRDYGFTCACIRCRDEAETEESSKSD